MRAVIERAAVQRRWAWFEEVLQTRLGISPTVVRFLIVGAIGYLVNQVFLFLLYDTPAAWFLPAKETPSRLIFFTHDDMRLLIAAIIAVEISIVSNFYWHNRWTFRDRPKKPFLLRYLQFNATSFGSPLISVGVVNVLTPYVGVNYFLANTIGILLGTVWNWVCNTRFVWRRERPRLEPPPGAML